MSYTHIFPNLFGEFRCIAENCPANCCRAGWSITWTAQEAERLCSVRECSQFFAGDEYRTIRLDENGACPFLTSEGLCGIQREHGERYLSYTCRQYPRISRLCGGTLLSSCRPTCFAVMDRLFSGSDSMDMCLTVSDSPTEAIMTAETEVKARLDFFRQANKALWNGSIFCAIDNAASLFNIRKPDDIQRRFAQRYGWEIITAEGKKLDEAILRSIALAYCMEWMINHYDADMTASDNMAELLFRLQALILAANGAAALCGDHTQLICSISDFIAAL